MALFNNDKHSRTLLYLLYYLPYDIHTNGVILLGILHNVNHIDISMIIASRLEGLSLNLPARTDIPITSDYALHSMVLSKCIGRWDIKLQPNTTKEQLT